MTNYGIMQHLTAIIADALSDTEPITEGTDPNGSKEQYQITKSEYVLFKEKYKIAKRED